MLPLDYLHALCLAGVALYIWRREPVRLLLTPLMLLSFLVLYGIGNIIYFLGADALPDARSAVTLSLILMWAGLITGIELSSRSMPALAARSRQVISQWRGTPLSNPAHADQLLATLGVLMALFMLAVFFGFGKLGQLRNFLSLESGHEKLQYRMELAGQGGYLYQLLVASAAPFVSFLLLTKAAASRRTYLRAAGLLLCAAVFAGKLGTFHKVPWLIYVLQLIIVVQLRKRLDIGVGRIVLFVLIVIAGAIGAAMIAIPELDATSIFGWLTYRFFEVNNEVIYQTFYVYPRYLPHTWGMNIGLVHGVFGSGELRSAHTEVASFFGAEGATFDAFFVADAWVDFGYVGVVLTALLVGFVVKTMDIYITSFGKTALAVALLGSGMYGVFQLQVTSAFTAFLTGGLLLIPLLVFAAQALINDLARGRIQWQR
ncbi:MAG TPA: hypothetical protein VGH75_09880 [Steroidobacteraceae bacterium]|jgi:hypothetical protein